MIYLLLFEKYVERNVSDAFRGWAVAPRAHSLRVVQHHEAWRKRIKNRSPNPTEKWLHFSLPLVTFLEVNYSSCFSPSVAGGQLLRLFQTKEKKKGGGKEQRFFVSSSSSSLPSTITQALPRFVSLFSLLLNLPVKLFYSTEMERGEEELETEGWDISIQLQGLLCCALLPPGVTVAPVEAICGHASAQRLAVIRSWGKRKGSLWSTLPLSSKDRSAGRKTETGACWTLWLAAPPETTVTFGGTENERNFLRLTVTSVTGPRLFARFANSHAICKI